MFAPHVTVGFAGSGRKPACYSLGSAVGLQLEVFDNEFCSTYKEKYREHEVTMLAPPATRTILPGRVLAIVVVAKTLNFPLHHTVEVRYYADRSRGRRRGLADLSFDAILSSHNEPLFVPLHACARLPPRGAQVTELISAATRHVETTMGKLDEVVAAGAALPSLLLGQRKHDFV